MSPEGGRPTNWGQSSFVVNRRQSLMTNGRFEAAVLVLRDDEPTNLDYNLLSGYAQWAYLAKRLWWMAKIRLSRHLESEPVWRVGVFVGARPTWAWDQAVESYEHIPLQQAYAKAESLALKYSGMKSISDLPNDRRD